MPVAAQPVRSPVPSSPRQVLSNLPVPQTPMVGRQREMQRLVKKLEDPDCRLVTLAAPGGFGKTRMAIGIGEIVRNREVPFPDGVYFVALESIGQPDLVVSVIANALQLAFYEQREQMDQSTPSGSLANVRCVHIRTLIWKARWHACSISARCWKGFRLRSNLQPHSLMLLMMRPSYSPIPPPPA